MNCDDDDDEDSYFSPVQQDSGLCKKSHQHIKLRGIFLCFSDAAVS